MMASNKECKKRDKYIKRAFLKSPLPIDMSVAPIDATDEHYQCHMKPGDTMEATRALIRHCDACDKDCNIAYFYKNKYERCIPCTLADIRAKKKKDNHRSPPAVESVDNESLDNAIDALTHAITVLRLQKERRRQPS